MPEYKGRSNLRQINNWQKAAARTEYLRHPDMSIAEVSKATGVATRTVARARAELVKEGLLPQGRNATTSAADAVVLSLMAESGSKPPMPEPAAEGPPSPPSPDPMGLSAAGATIDGEALRQMNTMLDDLSDEDDEVTRKRMLKQVKRFAFDPNLHPDTRMSASQLWAKLLDMQRSKDLGPGVPVTFELAVKRCTDFLRACGAKVAVPSFYAAFDLGEVPNGPSAQTVEQGQPTPASDGPSRPTDDNPEVEGQA